MLVLIIEESLLLWEKGLKSEMITALYDRHRICHRREAGEDEDRRLDAGGGVVVQGDTGHAPH